MQRLVQVNAAARLVSFDIGIPFQWIFSKRQTTGTVLARGLTMSLCREVLQLPRQQVAREFSCTPEYVTAQCSRLRGHKGVWLETLIDKWTRELHQYMEAAQ